MIWKIFARQPGTVKHSNDFARECYRAGVIAVGWSGVGDLNRIASRKELKRKLARTRNEAPRTIGAMGRIALELSKLGQGRGYRDLSRP